jgi:hypothetical protein
MPWLLLNVLAATAAIVLPGYCLNRRLLRSGGFVETVVMTLALGLSIPPTIVFVAVWALGTTISAPVVFGVSAAVVIACRPWSLPAGPRATRTEAAVVAVLAAAALAVLQVTEIHSVGSFHLFDSCMHSIVLYLQQYDGTGWSLYDPATDAYTTYVVNHAMSPGLGLRSVIHDVRAANGAMMASTMVLLGRAGVDLLAVVFLFLIAGGATLVASAYLTSWWARLAVGLATLAGAHGAIAYLLNENAFGLAFGCVLLFLLTKRPNRTGESVAAGALLGFAIGCRIPALMWILPVALILVGCPRRTWIAFGSGLLLSYLPWAAIYSALKGHPFYFPFESDVVVRHRLLGLDFSFRPLNWPFHDTLVRVPGHVLPPLFYVPIRILQSGGALLVAATLAGFALVRPVEGIRYPRWVAAAWALPVTASLAVQAYLDYEKASYLALGLPVVPLALAGFWAGIVRARRRLLIAGAWAVLAIGLAFVPGVLAGIDVPLDPRAHSEYRVVIPDNNNFERLHPKPEEQMRSELGRIALLPGFQDIVLRSDLWATLTRQPEGPRFESGRIVARFDMDEPKEIEFPVHATIEPPDLPPEDPMLPADIREFEIMYFMVHLRIPTGPEPRVRLVSRPDRFLIQVDPGPPPYAPRYVSFLVDEETSDLWWERFQDVDVEVGGRRLETRNLGFVVRQGDRQAGHVSIVTNLASPPQPRVEREIACKGATCRWEWTRLRPDGTAEPAEDAPTPPGEPILGIRGPVLY